MQSSLLTLETGARVAPPPTARLTGLGRTHTPSLRLRLHLVRIYLRTLCLPGGEVQPVHERRQKRDNRRDVVAVHALVDAPCEGSLGDEQPTHPIRARLPSE